MSKNENIDFEKLFKGKKIPILTLDERWYSLFLDYDKPDYIKEIEDNLNLLIKRQGKLVNDLKDLKNLKNKLLQEIITNMNVDESANGKLKAKKLDNNQKLIKEITEKMNDAEDELVDIPYQIKEVNEKLIVASSKVCYQRLYNNRQVIEEIGLWVAKMREELKERILIKQDLEMKNATIYSYMHDLLGPDLIQILDENLKSDGSK